MALFAKQDFSPPILSRRWITMKFRPNMVVYNHRHIISILESGLLFREDSIEVEQESPLPDQVWRAAGGGKGGWLTKGEALTSAAAVGACMFLFPPQNLNRMSLLNLLAYVSIPVGLRAVHRSRCQGSLTGLLMNMREYLALARRTAACLKEYAALHAQINSLSSVIESTNALLCRQQSELSVVMSRASSALLGNAPWLRADVAWDAVQTEKNAENLMKIHHAFLVVQSTFLKHVAMAHYLQPIHTQLLYKNYNERIYWLHTELLSHLNEIFKENYDSLHRMYRLLKNSASTGDDSVKKLGDAVKNNWSYSEVHTGVAKTCLELKLLLNKCTSLDMFLDSCAMNKQDVDIDILYKDLDDLIENLTKCLSNVQKSQLRLKRLNSRISNDVKQDGDTRVTDDKVSLLKIEDRVPDTKDEVFYFVKTDDDIEAIQPADVMTAPGKKERDNTKIVLCELKRKLGKREDVMRERERQALAKTMPNLKDVPEFERQIKLDEFLDKKGYIRKLVIKPPSKRIFLRNSRLRKKNCSIDKKIKHVRLKMIKYTDGDDLKNRIFYEANAKFNVKSKLLTFSVSNKNIILTRWCKVQIEKNDILTDYSDSLSDVDADTVDKNVQNHFNNEKYKFTKKDLDLSPSSSSGTEDDSSLPLHDVRKHRVFRKKNHPSRQMYNSNSKTTDNVDESLKPIEYSFGAGMSMASLLQINNNARLPNMAAEEVFIGDGEVSTDSGNDDA